MVFILTAMGSLDGVSYALEYNMEAGAFQCCVCLCMLHTRCQRSEIDQYFLRTQSHSTSSGTPLMPPESLIACFYQPVRSFFTLFPLETH